MPKMHFIKVLDFAAPLFFVFLVYRLIRAQRRPPLPPGPKGWPIIGNLFDVPKEHVHLAYIKMGRKYNSDLLYFDVAGSPMLIVNTAKTANDLFNQRSDRPRWTMLRECIGWDYSFAHTAYGERWKKSRAIFMQQFFSQANIQAYHKPCLKENMYAFLNRLLDTPQDFESHINLLFGGAILDLTYGISVKSPDNEYLQLAVRVMRAQAKYGIPGTYLVDTFPILKHVPWWLPGAEFKRAATREKKALTAMIDETLEFVKKNMENGKAKPSIASRSLQQMQDDGNWSKSAENLLKNTLAITYAAGADTTSQATTVFVLGLVCNTDVLKRGQAAVDAVVGHDRLPDFGDENQIPYVTACVMESLRWRPMLPLGMPHCSSEADIYRGYYIPPNTMVMGNSWAILHDPEIYGEDVDEFRPERFLNTDGTLNPNVPYPEAAFGFGRRICSGREIAKSSLWLEMALLLACFDISPAVDENGAENPPSMEFSDGFFLYPRPFGCNIKARSKAVEALIRDTLEI